VPADLKLVTEELVEVDVLPAPAWARCQGGPG